MNTQVKVGTIFSSSWGYEQTNITFYEVVKVSGSFVTVRRLEQIKTEEARAMAGTTVPKPGVFTNDEPLKRKLRPGWSDGRHGIRISSYEWAKQWDGEPENFTSYH